MTSARLNFFSRDVSPLSPQDQARMEEADEPKVSSSPQPVVLEPQRAQPKRVRQDSFWVRCLLMCVAIPDDEEASVPVNQKP
ncbi:MAG: hypothetical protein P4M12_00090 [Gammaproteobacteria bacterium]|nr:hypothetical protein [Gammaproteobacteria bacterium]